MHSRNICDTRRQYFRTVYHMLLNLGNVSAALSPGLSRVMMWNAEVAAVVVLTPPSPTSSSASVTHHRPLPLIAPIITYHPLTTTFIITIITTQHLHHTHHLPISSIHLHHYSSSLIACRRTLGIHHLQRDKSFQDVSMRCEGLLEQRLLRLLC